MKINKLIIILLIVFIPSKLYANLAISFLPDPDEMINFPLFNPWLFLILMLLKSIFYKEYIDKSFLKFFLINCINCTTMIIWLLLIYLLAFMFDANISYIFLFLRDSFDKLCNVKGKYLFHANLFSAILLWIIPILIIYALSVVIESWILIKYFIINDKNKISPLSINSNVLSFTIVFLTIIFYYFNLYNIYSPGHYK